MTASIRSPNSSDFLHEDSPKRPRSFLSQQTIKNLWSKLQENCQLLFRAIGLNILVSSFKFLRHPWGKGFEETTKIAIRKSHSVALLRAVVHAIPVGIALWEVTLNWNTYYVGSYLLKQVSYQTAAKIHEITIQASLTAIIFSYIRHQMVLGKGIPFGALFSGLQINQISYLWSMEFWGSMSSNYLSIWNKITMLVLISFCFILAAVAGPSSAILLIPRLSYWPAGSTHIWFNATINDIWPDRMKGSSVPSHCAVLEAGSSSNECPSSEWDFMQTWMSLTGNSIPIDFRNQSSILDEGDLVPAAAQLTGKSSTRQYKEVQGELSVWLGENLSSSYEAETADSTTQQAVVADALTSISSMWAMAVAEAEVGTRHGASFHDQQKVVHTIADNYYQPYSSAFCVRDAIQGPNDQRMIAIPIYPGTYLNELSPADLSSLNAFTSGIPAVEAPSIRRAQLLKLPGMESDNRVKWVQLPQNPFTGVSVGLVVLLPKNPSDSTKQSITGVQNNTDMVVCSIDAGWGASSINLTSAEGANSATSSLFRFDLSSFKLNTSSEGFPNSFQDQADDSVFFYPPIFPTLPIMIDVEWAEYLNPYIPSKNTTVLDFLLKQSAVNGSKSVLPEVSTREIITGLMTNGLARSGFTSKLQGNIKSIKVNGVTAEKDGEGYSRSNEVPDGNLWVSGKSDFFTVDAAESRDWVKLRVDSTIQGYAYNIEGPAPKVAIAFLLTYCCFALCHSLYSGISGISSTCWDSISEITALAINSHHQPRFLETPARASPRFASSGPPFEF